MKPTPSEKAEALVERWSKGWIQKNLDLLEDMIVASEDFEKAKARLDGTLESYVDCALDDMGDLSTTGRELKVFKEVLESAAVRKEDTHPGHEDGRYDLPCVI